MFTYTAGQDCRRQEVAIDNRHAKVGFVPGRCGTIERPTGRHVKAEMATIMGSLPVRAHAPGTGSAAPDLEHHIPIEVWTGRLVLLLVYYVC
jgi:hypothetical protein